MYLSDILFPIENRDDYVGEYLQICESPNYVLSYYAGIWSLTPDPNCKYYQVHEAFDIKYIYYYLEYSRTKIIYDKLDTTLFISKYYRFDDAPTLEKQTSISADIEKKLDDLDKLEEQVHKDNKKYFRKAIAEADLVQTYRIKKVVAFANPDEFITIRDLDELLLELISVDCRHAVIDQYFACYVYYFMIRKNIEFANGEDFINRKIRVVRDCEYDIDDQNIVVDYINNANGEVHSKKYDMRREILGYY